DFIGLMTYLDWAMVFVTSLSCWSMLFESPWPTTGENLIFNNPYLQITEYLYVVSMTFELMVKVIANGLFFTPKAVVKDVGDIMTFFIYFEMKFSLCCESSDLPKSSADFDPDGINVVS
ncbi:hypothetical protein TELCIR_16665, partial [Teladorsagia circumcincta]